MLFMDSLPIVPSTAIPPPKPEAPP